MGRGKCRRLDAGSWILMAALAGWPGSGRAAERPDAPAGADSTAPMARTDSTESTSDSLVSATMDTLRITADVPSDSSPPPPAAIDAPRDPRDEPLFVRYATPAQLMFLSDRLDLDKVRWRYRAVPDTLPPTPVDGPPDSAVAPGAAEPPGTEETPGAEENSEAEETPEAE